MDKVHPCFYAFSMFDKNIYPDGNIIYAFDIYN